MRRDIGDNHDVYAFDSAGMGRLHPRVSLAMRCYHRIEEQYPRELLHRLNMEGFDEDLDRDRPETEKQCLRYWHGLESFERRLLDALGSLPSSTLIDYGKSSAEIWSAVWACIRNERIFWTDEFYSPWATRVRRECSTAPSIGVNRWLCDSDIEVHRTVERVVAGICESRPRVVLTSMVTQYGAIVPVRTIVEGVQGSWCHPDLLPLFIVDGCQSFGRIPQDLSWCMESIAGVAYIGCFHKALRGPKEMAFLICTDGYWQRMLIGYAQRSGGCRGMWLYARSKGLDSELPAIDCSRAIGANQALEPVSGDAGEVIGDRARSFSQACCEALQHSEWQVRVPRAESQNSGIVVLSPPTRLCAHGTDTVVQMLADGSPRIAADALGSSLRVAFTDDHPEEQVTYLLEALKAMQGVD